LFYGRASTKKSASVTLTTIDIYSQQYHWRSWPAIFDVLTELNGQALLDLGCGIGDVAAELSARGASSVGVDVNDEAIAYASNRHIPNAVFRKSDLQTFFDANLHVDGIWSSFTAAYFPTLSDIRSRWLKDLRPGGWLALTEIDDLFGQSLRYRIERPKCWRCRFKTHRDQTTLTNCCHQLLKGGPSTEAYQLR
jgi:trans-aconitate methyltransferase